MTISEQPYFMTNPEWYYHDKELWKYVLTDMAPPEAVKSYEEFYKLLDSMGRDEKDG